MRKALLALLVASIATPALAYSFPTSTISSVSPSTFAPTGGEIVTIRGSNFASPVAVWVDAKQAFIVSMTSTQVVIVTPRHKVAEVPLKVSNVTSETQAVQPAAFRYYIPATVTAAGPRQGPLSGGTTITIEGAGFEEPILVLVAGVVAPVVEVTPTR